MCGRYHLNSTPVEIAAHFDVDIRDNFPPRYNIAPTQPIAVITGNERGERRYQLMRWGFIPSWAKGDYLQKLGARPLINARAETVLEKATFKNAFRRRRCLVPADGFYEWRGQKGAKQPYRIHRDGVFGFAGIWETAIGPDGGEADTVAILTTAAGEDLAQIHGREPIVINRVDHNRWLMSDERDVDALMDLLAPATPGVWTYYPVAKDVGAVRNDGPDLIEPLGGTLL